MDAPGLLIVGRLRKPQGVRGDLIVEPLTDAPADVFAVGRRVVAGTASGEVDPAGRELTLTSAHARADGAIVAHFAEIEDRSTAEHWRDRYLLLPAAELAPPREDEVYVHELVGMSVMLPSGEPLGDVLDVYELPQGLALDVSYRGGSVILPFRDDIVQRVDRRARRLVADPPEGLLE